MPPGDGSRVMPNKPAAARSLAYVLSQVEGADGELAWRVVFRSGPSAMVKPLGSAKDAPAVPIDQQRPDYENEAHAPALAREHVPECGAWGGLDEPCSELGGCEPAEAFAARLAADTPAVRAGRAAMAAMEGVAEDRERFALALPGDRHVLFLAVAAGELADYGVRL